MLKKLKRISKRMTIRFLKTGKEPFFIDQPEMLFHSDNIKNVLLLRQDRIGDVLISVPFVRILREALPGARIDILLSSRNYGVKRAVEDYTDDILVYDKSIGNTISLVNRIRKRRYDLIVDLFDNPSSTSSFLVRLGKARFSLGLDKDNSYVYTHIVSQPNRQEYHAVERICSLLMAFGKDPASHDLSLDYPFTDDEKSESNQMMGAKIENLRMGINLSGSSRSKYWGTDNYIEFINRLGEIHQELECRIFATMDYTYELKTITSKTNALAAPAVSSVHEYAALLSTCDFILTPDTAAVHFAAAWKIPCVALFDNSGMSFRGIPWYPYNSPHRIVSTESGNLENIKAEDVIRAFNDLIRDMK